MYISSRTMQDIKNKKINPSLLEGIRETIIMPAVECCSFYYGNKEQEEHYQRVKSYINELFHNLESELIEIQINDYKEKHKTL